jgi:hypothetical protein
MTDKVEASGPSKVTGPKDVKAEDMGRLRRLARRLSQAFGSKGPGVYVTGSGPVWVPEARLREVPRVIAEHHRSEAEGALRLARLPKRWA